MERSVTVLRVDEPARFNPDRLEELCATMGEQRAENEVARALELIGTLLQVIAGFDPVDEAAQIRAPLRELIAASELIGMATLARVGRDVTACLEDGNAVSLHSTLARLHRIGDRSIHAVWDLEDLSG